MHQFQLKLPAWSKLPYGYRSLIKERSDHVVASPVDGSRKKPYFSYYHNSNRYTFLLITFYSILFLSRLVICFFGSYYETLQAKVIYHFHPFKMTVICLVAFFTSLSLSFFTCIFFFDFQTLLESAHSSYILWLFSKFNQVNNYIYIYVYIGMYVCMYMLLFERLYMALKVSHHFISWSCRIISQAQIVRF